MAADLEARGEAVSVNYNEFLHSKQRIPPACGFDRPKEKMNPMMFEWQKDITRWALRKGRAALFEDCGNGKTIQQLEFCRAVSEYTGKPSLIVAPLTVGEQTKREADKFGYKATLCRTQKDVQNGINITNYEMLEHFDSDVFDCVVLDESSILKNCMGKVRTQIIEMFQNAPYRLSCTATPSPNDYMELGNQVEFLGIMSRTEMLATYFTHDGSDTSKWRLKGHAEDRFWEWVATWAVVLTCPGDLGYPNDGYILPDLVMHEYLVDASTSMDDGLFGWVAKTLTERRDARRMSLRERCEKAAELVATEPDEQWVVWCDLNDESEMLTSLIPGAVEVRGSDKPDDKAKDLRGFADGSIRYLVTKPSIAGFGMNWQNCHNMIFVGLSDSYEAMYQAIRRCYRFGQKFPVNVHIVTSAAEGAVKANIERKEAQAEIMKKNMVQHTKEILEQDIRGTVRIVITYNPQVDMLIPEWLRSAS